MFKTPVLAGVLAGIVSAGLMLLLVLPVFVLLLPKAPDGTKPGVCYTAATVTRVEGNTVSGNVPSSATDVCLNGYGRSHLHGDVQFAVPAGKTAPAPGDQVVVAYEYPSQSVPGTPQEVTWAVSAGVAVDQLVGMFVVPFIVAGLVAVCAIPIGLLVGHGVNVAVRRKVDRKAAVS